MGQEVLAVKLDELEEQFSRLRSRILLSESLSPDKLEQEAAALRRECRQEEERLQKQLRCSRAKSAALLADACRDVGRIARDTAAALRTQQLARGDPEAAAEEKILLAENALDFAVQAANRALLVSMEAAAAQQIRPEKEERSSL